MQSKLFNYTNDEILNLEPRLAVEEDINEIQNLLTAFSFVHKSSIKQMIEKNRVVVIGELNNIIGVIITNAYKNTISDLVVNPNYRGYKIGTKIFKYLVDYWNINALIIKATYKPYSSINFWETLGFKKTGKIFQKKGEMQLMEMVWWRYKEIII